MFLRYLGYVLIVVGGIVGFYGLFLAMTMVHAGKPESRAIVLLMLLGVATLAIGVKLAQ